VDVDVEELHDMRLHFVVPRERVRAEKLEERDSPVPPLLAEDPSQVVPVQVEDQPRCLVAEDRVGIVEESVATTKFVESSCR